MKKAFSLIELTIVVAITAVMLMAVTNYLISAVRNNNQVTIENEVRSEANSIMDQLAKDIRVSRCECLSTAQSRLLLYGTVGCDTAAACPTPAVGTPTPFAAYNISADGNLKLLRNEVPISSNRVWVRACTDCICGSPGAGLAITASSRVYNINLSLTQSKTNPRSDFCGKVTLNQVVSPRNKN